MAELRMVRTVPLPHPLYQEVASVIAAEIERGTLRPGTMLPSERTMCAQLGVSRVTLRAALAALAEQRLVVASRGRGWFVSDSMLGEPPNALQSFTELAAGRGLTSSSCVEFARVREASLHEADELEIAPGAPLFEMRRVRLLDGLPVAIDHARLPLAVCPALPTVDFDTHSLYATLEQHGVEPTSCDFSVQAVPAEPEHVAQLNVALGAPLLLAVGRTLDRHRRPIELSRVLFIGARYRFRASLYRRPQGRREYNRLGGNDDGERR
jgi:GntR family transcriptional regulator